MAAAKRFTQTKMAAAKREGMLFFIPEDLKYLIFSF